MAGKALYVVVKFCFLLVIAVWMYLGLMALVVGGG